MSWTVAAFAIIPILMLYAAYEAAVSFALLPRRRNGRTIGPTYSPGEVLWLLAVNVIGGSLLLASLL